MRSTIDPAAAEFIRARDFLLRHRDDFETAYRDFRSSTMISPTFDPELRS
jgi:hypothetical protein